MIHLGDICQICGLDIEPVDVVTGGSPCQDLSIAGNRAGLSGARSGLFREQVRVVREMRAATLGARPRFMVWENVPGALSSNDGLDFMEVLHECIKVVEPEAPAVPVPAKGWPGTGCLYDELGHWSVAWRIHNSRFWGVPQNRRRIALVCDFGGLRAPEILFERPGVCGNPATSAGAKKAPTGTLAGCAAESADAYGLNGDRHETGLSAVPEATHTLGVTLRESVVYDARGNGDGKVVHTLTGDHDNRVTDYTHVVVSIGNGQRHMSANVECAGTLNCMHDHETAIICDRASFNQGANAKYDPAIGYANAAPSLVARGPHAVAVPPRYTVRRLTPRECERLQGFPDDWTKPCAVFVDSRGRTRKITDTERYRAIGNSIALPFWRWLLARIYGVVKTYEAAPLLGSLFDGIGGFPLCWPGRAAWASEIDDFCVAITKQHFSEKTT